jgi:hypothetical protein
MMLLRPVVHLLLHLIIPGAVSKVAFADRWLKAWIIMMLAMLIDLDHLLAVPIYDPNRCSIGSHSLHSYVAMGVYVLLTVVPVTRILAIGLLIHIAMDMVDCIWMKWL